MEDPHPVIPFSRPVNGEICLPGSKSMTNRALILAALSSNSITLHNALISEDTLVMVEALRNLGFSITIDFTTALITVEGCAGNIPKSTAVINVGSAGTVGRFLTAMLCLHPEGDYYLDGSHAMRKRPIKELLDPLIALGAASVTYHEQPGHFPFSIKTHGLPGGELLLDASLSSQILSAVLLVAPFARSSLSIKFMDKVVSWPFIEMTLRMMKDFGQTQSFSSTHQTFTFTGQGGYSLWSKNYYIESDATAASYFFALVLILGGQLKFPGLTSSNSIQGDILFACVLEACGLKIKKSSTSWNVECSPNFFLKGQTVNFNSFSDTFLTFAAISPLLNGATHITGITHTRFQETNRIQALANELRKLNQHVIETQDSLTINPQPLKPSIIDTYDDHRIAMSFAILGSYDLHGDGTPWIFIKNPNCCAKTFPNFFNALDNIRTGFKIYK